MKAWLVLQEGPGAGPSYLLDPAKQPLLSLGRSASCDLVVNDQRVSRHHCDLQWNGRQWEVVDRGSVNGTYVNGTQIHGRRALLPGEPVNVGETTMALLEYVEHPAAPPHVQAITQPYGAVLPPQGAPDVHREQVPDAGRRQATADTGIGFWLGQGILVAAVICLAAGAFLPWLRVTGSLSSDLGGLVEGIASIVSSLVGDNLLSVTQDVGAFSGLGKLTLGVAIVCILVLFVDVFLRGRSILPPVVYLVISAAVGVVLAMEVKSLYDVYEQVQSVSTLFGVKLEDVVKAFGKFIEVKVTLLPGLYLTAAGLGLVLIGGIVRLSAALPVRGRAERA